MRIENIKESQTHSIKAKAHDLRIGKLLVDSGKITQEQFERVVAIQQAESLSFSVAAERLGIIRQSDIRHALSLHLDYPEVSADIAFSKNLVVAHRPLAPEVEALRRLRSQLNSRFFSSGGKSLAIVSPNDNEGTSTLAANLAVVLSQLGERTLLIDANLRDPSQHKIFNLQQQCGLVDVLVGKADLDALTKIEAFPSLTVLTAGNRLLNPQELLNRFVFNDFILQVTNAYDVIVLDTSPATQSTDAITVAERCDGTLLVSRLNETRSSDLKNVRDQLTISGINIIGAVLNDF